VTRHRRFRLGRGVVVALCTSVVLLEALLFGAAWILSRAETVGQGRVVLEINEGTAIRNYEYLSRGVLFQSGGGGLLVSAPSNPVSSPNVVSGTEAGPAGRIQSYQVPITAEFFINGLPGFVDFVSLDLTSSTSLSTLSAYDQNGALLVSDSGAGPDTLLVRFTGHIHSVALTGGPFAFDNFTFDGLVAVPEPSVTALAASGAGVLVFLGWRKRRSNRR